MNALETSIAVAAIRVYSLKGVKRTTMSDVAKEAGVTRQTVYNAFSNTDEVLRAAIRLYIGVQWQKIQSGWQLTEQLDKRLDILFQHFAIDTWEYVSSSGAAADLASGYNAVGRAEIEQARLGFRDDIAALFEAGRDNLGARGTSPEALSDLLSYALEGIKSNCKTRTEVEETLAALKAAVLALAAAEDEASNIAT